MEEHVIEGLAVATVVSDDLPLICVNVHRVCILEKLYQGADGLDDVLDVRVSEGRIEREAEGLGVKGFRVRTFAGGIAVGLAIPWLDVNGSRESGKKFWILDYELKKRFAQSGAFHSLSSKI
jgi:hypothetical protein